MRRLVLSIILGLTLVPLASAAGTSPLQQRLVDAGEITGYTPLAAHTFGLAGYARAAGLDPDARAKLAHAGLIQAAVENLRAPTTLPKEANGPSQSSVVEFGSSRQAAAFAGWLRRAYYGGGGKLSAGVHQTSLAIPGEPHALGLHIWGQTKQGRLDEYNAILVQGRYLDEIDVYTKGNRLTLQGAKNEFAAHFERLGNG